MSRPSHFYRCYGWVVLVGAAVSLVAVVPAALRVLGTNYNNVAEWLPENNRETEDLKWFAARFGSDEVLVASWPGCTIDDPRLEQLAESLRSASTKDDEGRDQPIFDLVFSGPEVLEMLEDEPLELSRGEAVERMRGWLVGADGKTSCVVAVVSEAGRENRGVAVAEVYRIAATALGIPPEQLRLGGPTVDSVEIDLASSGPRFYAMVAAALLISIVVAFFALRQWLLVLLVFLTAVYCELFCLVIMYLAGEHMNSILVMAPTLVYVLSISASIHLINYFQDAVRRVGWADATGRAVRDAFAPCALAAVTTSIGVASLGVSDLIPIRKFGYFAAAGTLAGFCILFLLLPAGLEWMKPAIRRSFARRKNGGLGASARRRHPAIRSLSRWTIGGWWWIVPLGIVVLAFFGAEATNVKSMVKLKSMFRPGARVIRNYAWLETHLGPLVPVEVVLRFPLEPGGLGPQPDHSQERLQTSGGHAELPPREDASDGPAARRARQDRALERMLLTARVESAIAEMTDVGATLSTATFAPPLPTAAAGMASAQRTVLKRKLVDEQTRDQFGKSGYYVEHDGEALYRITARVPALTELDYDKFLERFEATVAGTIREQAAGENAAANEVAYVTVGGVPLFNEASKELLDDLKTSILWAFGFIAAAMACIIAGNRRGSAGAALPMLPFATLIAMLPNVLPVLLVFGWMGYWGFRVDIGVMMTASVAMGIAVDDTLHFLTWFQRSLRTNPSRRAAVVRAYRRCAAAMTQTTLVCSLGLIAFATSEFVPMSRFSSIMAGSLAAALLGDLLFFPAVLASPLGKAFGGRRERRRPHEQRPGQSSQRSPELTGGWFHSSKR